MKPLDLTFSPTRKFYFDNRTDCLYYKNVCIGRPLKNKIYLLDKSPKQRGYDSLLRSFLGELELNRKYQIIFVRTDNMSDLGVTVYCTFDKACSLQEQADGKGVHASTKEKLKKEADQFFKSTFAILKNVNRSTLDLRRFYSPEYTEKIYTVAKNIVLEEFSA